MPELIISKFRLMQGLYDKSGKNWILPLETYKDVFIYVIITLSFNLYFLG